MEAIFQKVTPDDFDVDVLLKASREGHLYLSINCNNTSEELKAEIISYVCKIETCVWPQYVVHYIDLWKEILHHPKFPIDDFRYKKGQNIGCMNKRKVFAVVRYLNETCKIYRCFSASLARSLEGVTGKPSIYTCSSNNSSYALTIGQMLAIDHIVSRYTYINLNNGYRSE